MDLTIRESNRWAVAKRCAKVSFDAVVRDMAHCHATESGFVTRTGGLPAFDDTRFVIHADGKHIVVGITASSSANFTDPGEAVEVLFDPRCDDVGYVQFYFPFVGEPLVLHHLPYDEVATTATRLPQIVAHEWREEQVDNVVGRLQAQRILLVKLAVADVCADGKVCGMNVARGRPMLMENASWNLAGANGFRDASSFGRLFLGKKPPTWQLDRASLHGQTLHLRGRGAGTLTLTDPLGRTIKRKVNKAQWSVRFTLKDDEAGRFVLTRAGKAQPMHYQIDVPFTDGSRSPIGMYFDSPDDLRNGHYTPRRFAQQIGNLRDWGVERLWWIDYGRYERCKSFWNHGVAKAHAARTFRECGELLPTVTRACHEAGLSCFGTLKIFDQGFRHWPFEKAAADRTLNDDDNDYCPTFAPVADHQEAVMSANADWFAKPTEGVRTLRLISREPLPKVVRSEVVVWTSADNKAYRPSRAKVKVTVRKRREPHTQWTAGGVRRAEGSYAAHVLEITGLNVREPYIALQVKNDGFRCVNRRFALVEAIDGQGQSILTRIAYGGSREGFQFTPSWLGWTNYTEPIYRDHVLDAQPMGLLVREPRPMRQIIEPMSAGARAGWMAQVQWMLDQDVDGVDVRILCHHINGESWAMLAMHEDVQAAFRERYGRDVEPTAADMHRVAALRGEALTQFLREVREAVDARGKRLAVHLEPGVEVVGGLQTRMAMTLEWRKWITENIAHELVAKFWDARNRFMATQVLPLARAHGVAVHLCDGNSGAHQPRAIETCAALACDVRAAGVGVAFYENHGYQRMNGAGVTLPVGHANHAVRAAADAVRASVRHENADECR